MLSCLYPLFESHPGGIPQEETEQRLADMFADHANDQEIDIEHEDYGLIARRELRIWLKRELITERQGKIYATDALQQALNFIDNLDARMMTSTASRLSVVQREIENLESQLNPDPASRSRHLKQKMSALEQELERVEQGHVETLEGSKAIEGIKEVYALSTSLRADFRRVEDSYRDAERQLRQSIISEQRHRGEVVDKLLDTHDYMIETPEGQVFHGFHQQLSRSVELDNMKQRLRNILIRPESRQALNPQQLGELRRLVPLLVSESAGVIQARARSERDVKSYLKTGLAVEHHRVGQLLTEIMETALDIDWGQPQLRKQPGNLPPVAIPINNLPLIERLLFKEVETGENTLLELTEQFGDVDEIEDDFWEAFDSLDRRALIEDTLTVLENNSHPMSIAELSDELPPTHDLETLALWLSMAREAELPITREREAIELSDRDGQNFRFQLPKVMLTHTALKDIDRDL